MGKKAMRVLFVCVHNSARSQIAEAFLNKIGSPDFRAESAGLEPGSLNPYVVKVMQEIGYDLSCNETKSVFDFYRNGALFDYVVTVCDEGNSERCPLFPGNAKKLHWSFSDPSRFTGSEEDILEQTRSVRNKIEEKIVTWLAEFTDK